MTLPKPTAMTSNESFTAVPSDLFVCVAFFDFTLIEKKKKWQLYFQIIDFSADQMMDGPDFLLLPHFYSLFHCHVLRQYDNIYFCCVDNFTLD